MGNSVEEYVRQWADSEITEANFRLDHLEKRLYKHYEPCHSVRPNFWSRFESWLANVDADEDKKALFKLAPEIFYLGREEFEELYRFTYQNLVTRWLMDQANIDILGASAKSQLETAITATWFCPVTDSMRINSFFHVNNIPPNADFRPDWRSLREFGSPMKILEFCKKRGLTRIVLLEDFVGGGSQVAEAIEFAIKLDSSIPVLFIPLIVCPTGFKNLTDWFGAEPNFRMLSPLRLPSNAFFTEASTPFAAPITASLRKILQDTYAKVSDGAPQGVPPYGPYGYPPDDPIGGLLVMYSNTPDNTLPIIHHESGSWKALFPRHRRV